MEQNHFAFLIEGIKRNHSAKLFCIWTKLSGGNEFKDISYLEFRQAFCFNRTKTICAMLVQDIMRNNSVKLFSIWASDSGDVV